MHDLMYGNASTISHKNGSRLELEDCVQIHNESARLKYNQIRTRKCNLLSFCHCCDPENRPRPLKLEWNVKLFYPAKFKRYRLNNFEPKIILVKVLPSLKIHDYFLEYAQNSK